MGWMIWGSNPSKGKRFMSSPKCADWLWGPLTLLFNGYQGSFPGVQWLGHDADHSLPPMEC